MINILRNAITYYSVLILFYFFTLNLLYGILFFLAAGQLFYYKRLRRTCVYSAKNYILMPGISILVPAYNEELTIVESVQSLLKIDYAELEIIVINDGSRDKTMKVLQDNFKIFPIPRAVEEKVSTKPVKSVYKSAVDDRLTVIDKENGGKADSLNTGINYSRSRLFCTVDADTLIEKNALNRLVQFYLERKTKVIVLGGIVRVANDCRIENGEVSEVRLPKKFLPAMQAMEYIRAFLCGRTGWNRVNSLLIISGAFGLFERKLVIEAGGYRTDIMGEDMELVVRLHRKMREQKRPYKLLFLPDSVCWTQVPESLKVLARQRDRWQRGLIDTMLRHWKMVGNPRYGLVGLIAMPYFLLYEMIGPVVETTGYFVVIISYILGWLNTEFIILFLLLAILLGVFLSLFSLLLEEITTKKYERSKDIFRLFTLAVLENFGYRQLHSFWRLKAFFTFFRKKKEWGEMEKKAFTQAKGG